MKLPVRFKDYHFEIQHVLVLFIIVVIFQTALSFINSQTTSSLFEKAMDYYRRDSAERVADLTTTALELQLDQRWTNRNPTEEEQAAAILAIDKLLSQQTLQRNIDEVFLLIDWADSTLVLREGAEIYQVFITNQPGSHVESGEGAREALDYYLSKRRDLRTTEQIFSSMQQDETFHVLVPFYDGGEIAGAAYMKITPDIAGFVGLLESAYNQSGVLFTALILIGFLAMFFIYSYTARERELVQQQLFDQRSQQLREQVEYQKESLFTKRIYHAHHKAEKVMGYIKEDLRGLAAENLEKTRSRVTQYANFVSRVIYDMKSYDPPLHVIRNTLFQTRVNKVIEFIVQNIFQRVYRPSEQKRVEIKLDLQEDLPIVHVNEYVLWEIIEPLIQNAIDHNMREGLIITLRTRLEPDGETIRIEIEDNGSGIPPDLLECNENGIRALFLETISTKERAENSGYGCYLAHEISRRCGWKLDAENTTQGGALITILTKTG